MKTLTLWAGLLCLAACGTPIDDTEADTSDADTSTDTEADSDDDTSDDDTSDIDPDCPWALSDVDDVYPADGADNVWVSPTFDEIQADVGVLTGAVASVQTSAGVDVPGSSSLSGDRIVWTPTAGTLSAETTYDFIITSEQCALVVSTFTTIDDSTVTFGTDRTYVLDWSTAQGQTAFISDLLFTDAGLALWRYEADEFQLVPLYDDEQDECLPTTGALTTYTAPELFLFRVTQPLLDWDEPVYLVEADIRAVTDGSDDALVNVHITGFLDFSEAGDMDICLVADTFDLACVPCPDFADNDCLPIDLYGMTASASSSITPVDVDTSDLAECGGVE